MKAAGLPKSFEEALERVRASTSSSEGFAFLGGINHNRDNLLHQVIATQGMPRISATKATLTVTCKWLVMSSVESHMLWPCSKDHR